MADAARDNNYVPALIAVSSADGSTPIRIYANPTTHRLLVETAGATQSATWGAGGNTSTVTDANVSASSFISIMHTDTPNGFWKVVPGAGSFVITSSDVENPTLAFKYKILS